MTKEKFIKSPTISALQLLHKKDEIKIPTVQRDLVWSKSQKQLLIDSLLKDFDIPKLYFRDVEENGKKVYYVIDGQQRLFSIFQFLNDEYELPKDEDDYEGEVIAKKKYSELSSDLQITLTSRELDIVHLVGYSDDEIDETFLRLQNGTALKAAEKRRAIAGSMRDVVKALSENDIYDNLCDFKNTHYAYEDSAAKILKSIMDDGPTSISAQQMSKFYENNSRIQISDIGPKAVKTTFNFLKKAFKDLTNPHFKMYSILDVSTVVKSMLETYDLSKYPKEFGQVYLNFLDLRANDNEKPEEERDPKLVAYANCARADGLEQITYRQNLIKDYFLDNMTYLSIKDNQRSFTSDQRAALYRRDKGICQECHKKVNEDSFEADHVIPWSRGGLTQLSNGQVLCSECNKKKLDSLGLVEN